MIQAQRRTEEQRPGFLHAVKPFQRGKVPAWLGSEKAMRIAYRPVKERRSPKSAEILLK